MKKILFALLIACAVIGCSKSSDDDDPVGPTGSFSFRNGENGKLVLSTGKYEAISIAGESITNLNFVSSNGDVADVLESEGTWYIVAYQEGNATITATLKTDPSKTATLQVEVVDYIKNVKFSQVYWMQASEPWQDVTHAVIRMRYNRGIEIPDGGDAKLIGNYDHANSDTSAAAIQTWVDEVEPGYWYYLYVDEDGDSVGLFMDSVRAVRSWFLSTDAYFTGEGEFTVAGSGPLFEYTDFYMYDGKYSYCLGTRTLVDDVTAAGHQFVQTGKQPVPYPGAIQVGHFDKDVYLDFFYHALVLEEEVDRDDYIYYGKYDSYFLMYEYVTYSTGEQSLAGYDLGYANVSQHNENKVDFYLASDEATGWFKMDYYHIEATLFPEYYNYQLATEKTDEGVVLTDPLALAPTLDITYEGGELPTSAPAKGRARRNEMPVRTVSMNKQMSFANTVGATFRMVLSTAK